MIGRWVTLGFNVATLPARVTYRSARAVLAVPADLEAVVAELRSVSEEAAQDLQRVLAGVDAEMTAKTAHLDDQQKQQVAELALLAAEKHLSLAAINLLRALWLAVDAERTHSAKRQPVTVDHQP
tara:strand:- start:7129 stop:7503 length:375 start_codon:yes stop_codon:yes gene_type:complete